MRNQGWFLTNLRFPGILQIFKLVLEGNVGKVMPESSRLELLENFSTNFSTFLLYQEQKKITQDH